MRDLSLHVLDLMENSVRAGATHIALSLEIDTAANRLSLSIEDNGQGLSVPFDQALDPFYTTKDGKKTGLGLSLFKTTAEMAGGSLQLRRSELGGLAVQATMEWDHLDRPPVGDLVESLFSMLCTEPGLTISLYVQYDNRQTTLETSEILQIFPPEERESFAAMSAIKEALNRLYQAIPELYGA